MGRLITQRTHPTRYASLSLKAIFETAAVVAVKKALSSARNIHILFFSASAEG